MVKATLCAYWHSDHELPHWKCVLWFCAKFTSINLPDQETDYQYPNTSPSIHFHIYHLISRCTTHARTPLNDSKLFRTCKHDSISAQPTKIYTRKELVKMETTISNFYTSFYIPEIQKLAFNTPHINMKRNWRTGVGMLIICFLFRNINSWKFGTISQYTFPVW